MDTRRVYKRHLTHTDDAHLRTVAEARHDFLETVAGTEEVRTVNLVDLHSVGNNQVFVVL